MSWVRPPWLENTSFALASSFFSLGVADRVQRSGRPVSPLPDTLTEAPPHVFGRIDADTSGALVVTSTEGYAIGSASVAARAYDPGGTTTAVDRIVGPDRAAVLDAVLDAAAQLGDVQVIVVAGHADRELAELVARGDATRPVDLWHG